MKEENHEDKRLIIDANVLDDRRFVLSDEYKENFQVPIKDRIGYDYMFITEVVYELNHFEKKYNYLMGLLEGKIAEYELALDYSFNITTQKYLELFIKDMKEMIEEMVEW